MLKGPPALFSVGRSLHDPEYDPGSVYPRGQAGSFFEHPAQIHNRD